MQRRITLEGRPQSTNHLYRVTCAGKFPRMYMTHEGKAKKESYEWQAKMQWKDGPLKGEVHVEIRLFFPDRRVRDIDNYNKIVLDALTGIVWEDDKQITRMLIDIANDKENPRTEIQINPL